MGSETVPPATLTRPEQLLALARLVARAQVGGVSLLSADGELVEHLTVGFDEEAAAELRRSSWPAALVHAALGQPGPVCLSTWPAEAVPPEATSVPPVGAFLGVPLNCPGRCRGVLYLCRPIGAEAYNEADVEAVQSVSRFLEQGSLFEEARLLARLNLLNRVAQASAGNLDLAPILRVALRELDRLLPMQVCAVWLVENSYLNEAPARSHGSAARFPSSFADAPPLPLPIPLLVPEPGAPASLVLADTTAGRGGLAPGVRLSLPDSPFASCLHNGEPLFTDLDRSSSTPHAELSLGVHGGACCFAVPLRAGDRTVGVLHSVCLRPSGFGADQVQLFHLVADLLGPAISNCQLFGRLSSAYEALRQTQTQLVQTEKMRALGELAGGMAHEFNNALCGALGFLELSLRSPALPPSTREHLEAARVCCLDAAKTVSRVQDFARWKRDGAVDVVDLDNLVRQTIELARHKWDSLAHARGAPIHVETWTEARSGVVGSPNELREVLTNLLFNAVDAMPDGGNLSVRTWREGSSVLFSVRDTGTGISEAVRRRLFEPFFTTKGERGNGLGLSVSFGIVRRHGGDITVQSQPGQGATFTVRLPAHNSDSASRGSHYGLKRPTTNGKTHSAVARSLRILVVDDEECIRGFLDAGLTGLGHRPVVARNAREALEAFAREPFDLVLTDLGMPEVSGEDVARAVHRQSPTTPVVVLTGWADQLQAEGAALEGVDHVLPKPITLSKLSATLAAVCG
jgi:signal transduction histidine kinase